MEDEEEGKCERPRREARKCSMISKILMKEERKAMLKEITGILKKDENERSEKELKQLNMAHDVVKLVEKRAKLQKTRKERLLEIEDSVDVLDRKCKQLAEKMKVCNNIVVYTGAGISTAASIPDYRGPNGIWTLLKKGQEPRAQDLSDAEPTFTHMSITKLQQEGHISYVVSQNCDGLHLRSGFPRHSLSEVHGNMYLETCYNCKPRAMEYVRLFDVTENTAIRRHNTGRFCHMCGGSLKDTIVHFGEKGGMKSPYHWKKAVKAASNADMILCLGTSLKVLRKYPCLWALDKRPTQRPILFVVNLQWTPKDDIATLKINGRCDDVMSIVMNYMNITVQPYKRPADPIFRFATSLKQDEKDTTEKKILQIPTVIKPKTEDICRKQKTKNNHDTLCNLLDSPPNIPFISPVLYTDPNKVKREPVFDRKKKDISLEVREKLADMLRKNPNISVPTIFHNPMIPQLPVFQHLPQGTPFMIAGSHLDYQIPSTSTTHATSTMHKYASNVITQEKHSASFHSDYEPSTSIKDKDLKHLADLDVATNDSNQFCKIKINVKLDHNYFKRVVNLDMLSSTLTDNKSQSRKLKRKLQEEIKPVMADLKLEEMESDSVSSSSSLSSLDYEDMKLEKVPFVIKRTTAPGWYGKGLSFKRKKKT